MNMNELAREVTLREGKKKSLSIAQVKEVLKCLKQVIYLEKGAEEAARKYLRLPKEAK